MAKIRQDDVARLDEAARAGWLYYVAGNTQDEIAAKLGCSRQTAQRLVSLSISAGLVKVRIDHPIAACLELARALAERFGLAEVEVVPSDPASSSTTLGIAQACAASMERRLLQSQPLVFAIGTGRTLKAAVEHLPSMSCPQHRIVSLTGSIAPDGSAAIYNVIFSMADAIQAPHYPMPLPVAASSQRERELLHEQRVVQNTLRLAAGADVAFIGIGEIGHKAPLYVDGFITEAEQEQLLKAGGVGEITGWVFDAEGGIIDCAFNKRVASSPIPSRDTALVIAVAMGHVKTPAIRAAATGHLISGLITDEATARALLAM